MTSGAIVRRQHGDVGAKHLHRGLIAVVGNDERQRIGGNLSSQQHWWIGAQANAACRSASRGASARSSAAPSPRQALPCMQASVRGLLRAPGARASPPSAARARSSPSAGGTLRSGRGCRPRSAACSPWPRLGEQVAAEEGAASACPSAGRSPSRAARAACRTTAACAGRARAARRRPARAAGGRRRRRPRPSRAIWPHSGAAAGATASHSFSAPHSSASKCDRPT